MASVTRTQAVTYGGFLVGGASTDRPIDGKIQLERTFDTSILTFTFLVHKNTAAAFDTEIKAVESAFTRVRQDTTVAMDGNTHNSFSHTTFTGFDSFPTIVKAEDVADTGRSRRYTVRIEFGMPADQGTLSGRRSSTVSVIFTPSRLRQIVIEGIWTALSSVNARDQYDASIVAFQTAVLSDIDSSASFELAEETADSNTDDTLLTFRRVFDEINFNQAGAADDPAIVRQTAIFSRVRSATERSVVRGKAAGKVKQLTKMLITYNTSIDKDITKDLKGKWDTIRPGLIATGKTILGVGAVALIEERVDFNKTANTIQAALTIMAGTKGNIIESLITISDSFIPGRETPPLWTGDAYAKYLYQGPAEVIRTITVQCKLLKTIPLGNPFEIANLSAPAFGKLLKTPKPKDPAPKKAFDIDVVKDEESQTPGQMGLDANTLDTVNFTRTTTLKFFIRVAAPKPITLD